MMPTFLKNLSHLFFLRRNFFLLLVFCGLAGYSLRHYSQLPGDNARIQIMLAVMTLSIGALVLLFSLFTSLFPLLRLWFKKRVLEEDEVARENVLRVGFAKTEDPGTYIAEVRVAGTGRPWLGFARVRLYFEEVAKPLDLIFNRRYRERNEKGILARRQVDFPHVADYRVHAAILFFEDFFHLFSFPFRETKHLGTFTVPRAAEGEPLDLSTETTEDPVLKVMHQKLSRGELFDYKKYAPGDDVRRIIWKNYARNRELTVRIPDRNYPYVSHINLLVSFYDASRGGADLALKRFLLDVYKEKIRQVVDALTRQNYTVKLMLDQETVRHYQLEEGDMQLFRISAAHWQQQQSPKTFLEEMAPRLKNGSNLLLVSSLCPAELFKNGSGELMNNLNIALYPAMDTLQQNDSKNLLKQLFFVDVPEPLERARKARKARPVVRFLRENDPALRSYFTDKEPQLIVL